MKSFAKQALIVVVSVVILAEIYYRATGQFATYMERTGQPYATGYAEVRPAWYHTRAVEDTFTPPNTDFQYPYSTNSLGIREKQIAAKKDSTIRIVVTGDSFTEGYGAPYDSTWPRLLEAELNRRGYRVEVINAGVAGSDIFFGYIHYRDVLNTLHPGIVIAAMNTSDYTDVALRGGMERFRSDSTTRYKSAPWYEPVYHYSHFARAIIHAKNKYPFDGLFISEKDFPGHCANANNAMAGVLKQYQAQAGNNGSTLVALFHTIPDEIAYNDFWVNQCQLKYFAELSNTIKANGIQSINVIDSQYKLLKPLPQMQYTYKNDRHYTPYGYNIMAQLVATRLIATGILKQP